MPDAVTAKVDINAKSINKKIKFDDDGVDDHTAGTNSIKATKTKKEKKIKQVTKQTVEAIDVDGAVKKLPKKIKFTDNGEIERVENNNKAAKKKFEKKSKAKTLVEPESNNTNTIGANNSNGVKTAKKIKFTDDGEIANENEANAEAEEDYFEKREKERFQKQQQSGQEYDAQKKWYHVYSKYPCSDDVLDMKDTEQMELYNLCKAAFEAELPSYNKRNPSDARWLQTALYKGTARDRANAGALLVTSNPLGNLEALATLIGFTKMSNKSSADVIGVLTDLWREVLLPPQRKLLSIPLRGADWKELRKDENNTKEKQRRVLAYWYFENELKDQYFEFLKNLQQGIQTGQENSKNNAILAASQLLAYAPEKEQMLLTMLVNKLGDPIPKIASKALHHLTDVAHRHPNMCGVIVAEAEKLLFRNNISDRAQHFTLCFLASIAPAGRPDVCTKLVHICFALFKVLVQKGAVNNRTMQAILRCLQKAILEAQPASGSTEVLSKEMQDTIYRLVHLADIRVSVQTLGLLLQLITVKTEKSDRFYNALYIKLLDINLINIGVKTAAQLLHIVHRAIHIDTQKARVQAFIKRLLQLSLYMPPHIAAGCLIVIHKLMRNRHELVDSDLVASNNETFEQNTVLLPQVKADDVELAKFDSDGEEKYEDITEQSKETEPHSNEDDVEDEQLEEKPVVTASWHHAKVSGTDAKTRDIGANKYDPYHRVPAFAGAEFALRNELLRLREHYHPTVQVFADNILNKQRIEYYGDPLRDFGLPHFLERFAFKNPKKMDNQKAETVTMAHKHYTAYGTRGKSVKSLTKANCTEDEMYIFNFLEHKRKQAAIVAQSKKALKTDADEHTVDEENDDLKAGDVDDDEFEAYLDGFFGKKAKAAAAAEADASDEELDFLQELGGELKTSKDKKKQKKKASKDADDDIEDIDADWGDDDDDGGDFAANDSDMSDDDAGSIDLDNDDDDDAGSIDLDNDDDDDDDEDDDAGSISMDEADDAAADTDDDDEENISDADSYDDAADSDEGDDDMLPPKSKKSRKETGGMNERSFAKKLKHSADMSSLFAAADDFAELLEETGKTKGQGTSNAVFNKDKSSDKQMKWEEKRHSNTKNYSKKKFTAKFSNAKKRKH